MTHWRDATMLAGSGLAGCGGLTLAGAPSLGNMALAAGVAAGAGVGVLGERTRRRRRLADRVVEAIGDTLDAPYLDRGMVRLRSWTNGWPGTPQRIKLYYQAASRDLAPEWKAMVLELLFRRLMAGYRIVGHDQLDCVLYLELDTAAPEEAETPYAQVRAVSALARQIDKSVQVLDVEMDGGELQSITVKHEAGDKMAAAGAQARVERIFDTMHPDRWRAKWDTEADTVRFEKRPKLEGSVWIPVSDAPDVDDLLANYDQVAVPVGIDEDKEELVWRPAITPHMLVTGETGSGKTSTVYVPVEKIAKYGWPVWIVDGKRVEFLAHRTWPNVQVVASTIEHQVAVIHRAHMLMEERYRLIEEEGFDTTDFEPLLLVLDELAEFIGELNDWYGSIRTQADPRQPPVIRLLQSLVRKARTARIHLVISLQRPDVQLLGGAGGEMRSNVGFRISVGRLDPQGAIMMWNSPRIGINLPRGLRQRAMVTGADGQPVEAQCYRFPSMKADPDSEEGQLREQLRPAESRHPRLLILPPKANTLPDLDQVKSRNKPKEHSNTLGYWDYALTAWDRAENHPELDPVVQGERKHSRGDARQLASTMAVLGLETVELTRRPGTLGSVEDEPALVQEMIVDEYDLPLDLGDYSKYDEPTQVLPGDLQFGDLIQVDDADGGWAVVDEDPQEDALDEQMVAVSWRDDADQYGSVSLAGDTFVLARRPKGAGL